MIKINTGITRLDIERDGIKSEISFNANDIKFVKGVYALLKKIEEKQKHYLEKENTIDENQSIDSYGMPINLALKLEIMEEICADIRTDIDLIFGQGTSDSAFGEYNTLGMFEQFFNGIAPYIQKSGEARIGEHIGTKKTKSGKKVMM